MTMQDIYNFMAGRDVSESFKDKSHNSVYGFGEFVAVADEVKVIKGAVDQAINDNSSVTKTAVVASIESDLDVSAVLDAYIAEKGVSTWSDFKASYNPVEVI